MAPVASVVSSEVPVQRLYPDHAARLPERSPSGTSVEQLAFPRTPVHSRDMRIYTKTGDAGETGLFGGGRVVKHHPRVEAYGEID